MSSGALHHLLLRKRAYSKLEPYPHPDKTKRYVDKVVMFIGVLNPLFTAPQVYDIYVGKNASGVSTITWLANLVFAVFWVLYGYIHKERPIFISNVLWCIFNLCVTVGSIIY